MALVLLPALFGTATNDTPLWMALGLTAMKVTALVAFTAIVGTRVIPRVLDYVADTRSRELFTLTVLVIALGIAVGSSLDQACQAGQQAPTCDARDQRRRRAPSSLHSP